MNFDFYLQLCLHLWSCRLLFVLQLVENCVCLLRNLSYHVHREVPGSERYAEAAPLNQGPATANKGGCFGSRKGKGQCQTAITVSLIFAVERWVAAGAFWAYWWRKHLSLFFTLYYLLLFFLLPLTFPPIFLPALLPFLLFSLLCLDEWFSKGKILLLAFSWNSITCSLLIFY